MKIKSGVRIYGVRPEILLALQAASDVYREFKKEMMVTSIMEGTHSAGSLHYTGCAVDLSVAGLSIIERHTARKAIQDNLGKDFDVLDEENHIHIEFQPKDSY